MSGENDHPEHEEHWLKKIVREIKEKDHHAAVELKEQQHRAETLRTKGPIFWRSLSDFVGKFIEEMKLDFATDVTADNLSFTGNPGGSPPSFSIKKDAFPFVTFGASGFFTPVQQNQIYYTTRYSTRKNLLPHSRMRQCHPGSRSKAKRLCFS
ncbi:MAG: hypothetical protein ABSG41_01030 [Bryobacteraceae bacterium]|jgi:hypothetical protein